MHHFILLSSLILSLNAMAADIRGGRCFPQSTQEIINLYQQGLCGEQRTGLQPKGLNVNSASALRLIFRGFATE